MQKEGLGAGTALRLDPGGGAWARAACVGAAGSDRGGVSAVIDHSFEHGVGGRVPRLARRWIARVAESGGAQGGSIRSSGN